MHILQQSLTDVLEDHRAFSSVAPLLLHFLLNPTLQQMHFQTNSCILIFVQFLKDLPALSVQLVGVERFSDLILSTDVLEPILLESDSHF